MKQFLKEETLRDSEKRAAGSLRVLWILVIFSAALLIVLCLLTRTGNAQSMLVAAWACTILSGWAVTALWLFRAEPARAEERHLKGLAEAETVDYTGRIFLSPDSFRIPKSVWVAKVKLETDEETLSLNLNEKLRMEMPPDGSLVRVTAARKFITGLEVLERETEQKPERKNAAGRKRTARVFFRFFPAAVLWAMMALIMVGFIFNRITDTDPAHKISIYADCTVLGETELAENLEKGMDGTVRMVKVHPFTYVLFGTDGLKGADLFIVSDSRAAEYGDWFAPEEESIPVYDPETGLSVAGKYFLYVPEGKEKEPYRLYFGAGSVHLEDGLARKAAELLLSMETEKEGTP